MAYCVTDILWTAGCVPVLPQFSTAAAWATRDEHLRSKEAALMGVLAQPGGAGKAATPPPPAEGEEGAQEQQPGSATAAAAEAAGESSGLLGAGSLGSQEAARLAEGMDVDEEGYNPTEGGWGQDGGGTPTRPASEEPDAGAFAAAVGGAVADSDQLPHVISEQLSNQQAGAAAAAAGGARLAHGDSLTSTPSLSLGGAGGSAAGVAPGGLQALGSVTSKTSAGAAAAGGALAGIDWAAIKSEALKAAPVPPPPVAKLRGPAAAAGGEDDAPYNPEEEDEQPYDPTEGVQEGPTSPAAAAAGGSADAVAAGFADVPDMLPVVSARPQDGPPGPAPGQLTWHGCFVVSSGGTFFSSHVQQLGGMGEVGRMMGPPGSNVSVIGRVALDKFAQFVEELRSSRSSRTISLGLVVAAPGAPGPEVTCFSDTLDNYGTKGRIGKLGLSKEVEGYLIAPSGE